MFGGCNFFRLDSGPLYVYHLTREIMIDLFSVIPLRMQGVSGSYLQTQIQIQQKDLFTGMFHLSDDSASNVLLFLHGKLVGIYRQINGSWETLSPALLDNVIAAARGDLRLLSLPEDGLRLYRLLLESDFTEAFSPKEISANALPPYFSILPRDGRSTLALVSRDDAIALILLSTDASLTPEGILITASNVHIGSGVMPQIIAWGDRICRVGVCRYNPWSEAWKEFSLRITFSSLVNKILARYEELAGRFLVSDLDEQVNLECNAQGWAISFYGSSISNRHFFDTAENAAHAYSSLLQMIESQIDIVVGAKMANQILQDALMQLPVDARQMLREQVIAQTVLGVKIMENVGGK